MFNRIVRFLTLSLFVCFNLTLPFCSAVKKDFSRPGISSSNSRLKSFKNEYRPVCSNTGLKALKSGVARKIYRGLLEKNLKIEAEKSKKGETFYPIEPIPIPYCDSGNIPDYDEFLHEARCALNAFLNDYPECFWVAKRYFIQSFEDGILITFYSDLSPVEVKKLRDDLERKISQIITQIPADFDPYKSELWIYNYLAENAEYNHSKKFPPTDFNVYGCLVLKTCVCEGFSKAFKLLCNRVGIETETICGISFGELHMWNLVKISEDWYHVDVTWASGVKSYMRRHDWFNVTNSIISKDHEWKLNKNSFREYGDLRYILEFNQVLQPEKCVELKKNFYQVEGLKFSESDKFCEVFHEKLIDAAKTKEKYLHILLDSRRESKSKFTKWAKANVKKLLSSVNGYNKSKNKFKLKEPQFSYSSNQDVISLEFEYF
ncbi:MAG: hypothetical protein LBP36_02880 [Oscillospiraceae bacterium]|jgi:hypothetical protein|nr:hypothetical protein [Oscillospiraceae bacterium]